MTEDEIAAAEALYETELTPREHWLLTQRRDLLGPLEKQEVYILRMSLIPLPCPACGVFTCQLAAVEEGVLPAQATDDDYRCRKCATPLTWHLGITGDQFFTVNFPRRQQELGEQ